MSGKAGIRLVAIAAAGALIGLLGLSAAETLCEEAPHTTAAQVLKALDSPRGLCVVIEDRDARLAIQLARQSELLVYVQLAGADAVASARRAADAAGLLNRRVYVDEAAGSRIGLADNLADAVVARGDAAGRASEREVLRVLRPGGKAILGSRTLVKPAPAGIDEWTHPFHGPDNNPQSADQVARAPYLTQFLAEPWYCPMPEVTVVSAGRVFKAFGNRAFLRPQWPMLHKLIAVNGYNGTLLWQRELDPDFMIHRNTMIATPEVLCLADDKSCKVLDALTGKLRDEIKVPESLSDGPVWKWMALEKGTLYALVGQAEPPGDKLAGEGFRGAGWPWWEISNYAWGFGRTLLAIDTATKKILWHHREDEPLDTRATCMAGGRIYSLSQGNFLACYDAKTGDVVWKTSDPEVLDAIGKRRPAQRAVWGFATTAFVKCSGEALFFAGPQQEQLVAVSARDGKLLWTFADDGNFQLVLRDDGLYAMGSNQPSRKFDPHSGEILLQLPNRAACTRATGSIDRVFVRGRGTRCWDVAAGQWLHLSPMRPACHDGVVIADGHLYWGPWMCGCNLSLIGMISLGPAGDFDFQAKATDAERLVRLVDDPAKTAPLAVTDADWPAYRKDNARGTRSSQAVAADARLLWQYKPKASLTPSAPVAVAGLAMVGGSDGVVRALDASDGTLKWASYTGGAIRVPPAVADGRALVGSADGCVYALEAATGRPLWRFRAAPAERKIPVYGALSSTWPVAGGVLVEKGVAYAAAGIANYDGTHVYALDAATGAIRWQNNTSGVTPDGKESGVSVQGDLLAHNGKLYLAGGNWIPLASYDLDDGSFQPAPAAKMASDRRGPRGHDLFVRSDGTIGVAGRFPLYTRPVDVHYIDYVELACPGGTLTVLTNALGVVLPGGTEPGKLKPLWTARPLQENVAVAVAKNAIVVAGTNRQIDSPGAEPKESYAVMALDVQDGKPLWTHDLPAGPVGWGVAVDRQGRVLVALRDGRVLCFGT